MKRGFAYRTYLEENKGGNGGLGRETTGGGLYCVRVRRKPGVEVNKYTSVTSATSASRHGRPRSDSSSKTGQTAPTNRRRQGPQRPGGYSPDVGGSESILGRAYENGWASRDYTSAGTFACNNGGQAGGGQLSANVKGGSVITAKWNQWTHAEGPVMVYMAKCSGACTSANSNSLSWFKISETGLISGTLAKGQWGNGLIMKNLAYNVTIPRTLANGEYLIRASGRYVHELLALHQANTPQFYPECAQLILTGGGSASPPSNYLTKFPGGYSMTDPGVRVDIYSAQAPSITTYKVPGPAVWSG